MEVRAQDPCYISFLKQKKSEMNSYVATCLREGVIVDTPVVLRSGHASASSEGH